MRALRRLLPTLLVPTLLAAACGGGEGDPPRALRLVQTPAVAKLQKVPGAVAADVPLVPRGGRAALQVAFTARDGVTVGAEPLVLRNASGDGLAPATVLLLADVRVARNSDSVRGGLTGSIPDPLLPLPATARDLQFQSLYVEVAVARTAKPGRYTGDLVVHAGTVSGSTQIAVDVADVRLPAERTLRTWFLVWDDRAETMEKAPIRDAYHALLKAEGVGDGTAASADLAVGIDVASATPDAAPQVEAGAKALREQRPDAIPYSYEFDEPPDDEARGEAAAWGRALHAAAPDVRQLVTAPPWDGLAPGDVGTFAVHLRHAAASTPNVRALAAELWIYNSCCERRGDPTLLLDDVASSNAAVAPAAWLAGGKGVLYWGVSAYNANPWRIPSTDRNGIANGDGVLLYPGRPVGLEGPVPSLRLKLFAIGMQLVDLAALAEARGAGQEARSILSALVSRDQVDLDGASWEAAQRRLISLAGGG